MTLFIEQHHSLNFEPRKISPAPSILLLHYTERDAQWSHDRFMNNDANQPLGRASSHYMVLEDGKINQYVHEKMRAWHAGKSYWAGETDINSASIGIEIVNMGEPAGYPPFAPVQIAAVIELCRDILHRHPLITPYRVLGHSDVAPGRKLDPGPAFPWAQLADAGVGYSLPTLTLAPQGGGDIGSALTKIGYNPDAPLNDRLWAFCAHYAPECLNAPDIAAAATAKILALAGVVASLA